MKNKEQLYKQLVRKQKYLRNRIEHLQLYNIRNLAIRALLNSGIAVDYALPFLMSVFIIGAIGTKLNITPFIADERVVYANIETIDTSSGIHIENSSYDVSYDEETIEYTTGWQLNKYGLYERISTSYRISKDFDITNIVKVLSMTKEELDNVLIVTNIKRIYKETLNSEDMIYNQDAVIVINNTQSRDEYIVRKESELENLLYTIGFIVAVLILGFGASKLSNIFIKTKLRDKFKEYKTYFKKMDSQDLEKFKQILQLENQNLAMLDDTTPNIIDLDRYSY